MDQPTGGQAAAGSSEERLAEVLDDVGTDVELFVQPGAQVRCGACRELADAADVEVEASRRLEGASDPADMSMVNVIRCPNCGRRGVLVTRFGPEASADEADVLVALGRPRHDGAGSAGDAVE